jgi:hypothetical protein
MPVYQYGSTSNALIKDKLCFNTGTEKLMLEGIFEMNKKLVYKKIKKATVLSAESTSTNYAKEDVISNVNISSWTVIDCLTCPC